MARWNFARRNAAMLESRRYEGFALLAAGHSAAEVARRLAVSRAAVARWRRQVEASGPDGLRARARAGRPPRVDRRVQAQLGRILAGRPRRHGAPCRRWTLSGLAEAAASRWGYRYARGGIWRILRAQGFRWRPAVPDAGSDRASGGAAGGGWVPGRRVLALLYSHRRPRRRSIGRGWDRQGRRPHGSPKRSSGPRRPRADQAPATAKR